MNKLLFTGFLLLLMALSVYPISRKRYSLSNGYKILYDGVGRDWRGNIYIGAGDDSPKNAALFKYNFSSDRLDFIFEVDDVSKAVNNWLSLDKPGKIHTTIKQGLDGKMYFGTHSDIDSDNDLVNYPANFRGGHFYSYDPVSGAKTDVSAPGVGIPGNGIMDVALGWDSNYDYVYAIGYPFGTIHKQNIQTHVADSIGNSGMRLGTVSRNLFSDNFGRLYYVTSSGRLKVYDPGQDSSWYLNSSYSQNNKYMCAVVKSWTGDSIYYMSSPGGKESTDIRIFRLIVSTGVVQEINHLSMTGYKSSLAYRWDLHKLYFAVGKRLYSVDVRNGSRRTEYSSLPDYRWSGCNGVDKNGDLWFTRPAHESNYVLRVRLDTPCAMCSQQPLHLQRSYIESLTETENNTLGTLQTGLKKVVVSPNPAFSTCAIKCYPHLTKPGAKAALTLYDVRAKVVQKWEFQESGSPQTIVWDGKDRSAKEVTPGIYVAKYNISGSKGTQQLIVKH